MTTTEKRTYTVPTKAAVSPNNQIIFENFSTKTFDSELNYFNFVLIERPCLILTIGTMKTNF